MPSNETLKLSSSLKLITLSFSRNCQKNLSDLFRYRDNVIRSFLSQLTAWGLYIYCKWKIRNADLYSVRQLSCPWKDMAWCHTVLGCTACTSLTYACAFFPPRCWRRMIAGFIVDVSEEQLPQSSWSVLIGIITSTYRIAGGVRTQSCSRTWQWTDRTQSAHARYRHQRKQVQHYSIIFRWKSAVFTLRLLLVPSQTGFRLTQALLHNK